MSNFQSKIFLGGDGRQKVKTENAVYVKEPDTSPSPRFRKRIVVQEYRIKFEVL